MKHSCLEGIFGIEVRVMISVQVRMLLKWNDCNRASNEKSTCSPKFIRFFGTGH